MKILRNPLLIVMALALVFITGCASERKARQAEREKVANSTGMFCDFVNGDQYHDVDVQMNFQMAKRCDPQRPFSVTNYRNSSEIFGVIYCCNTLNRPAAVTTPTASAVAPKAGEKPSSTLPPNSNPPAGPINIVE